MTSQATLSAASNDRKAKLARLKSLKQKQAPTTLDENEHRDVDMSGQELDAVTTPDTRLEDTDTDTKASQAAGTTPSRKRSRSPEPKPNPHLSNRNYDPVSRGPRLGFETAPSTTQPTIEARAAALARETKKQREEEEKADKPLDLFKLQPKKPNWDLKRDLEKKLKTLDVRTENAIAAMVRERVLREKEVERRRGVNGGGEGLDGDGDGEAVGMEGKTLVEAMHQREREEEEDERREKRLEEEEAE